MARHHVEEDHGHEDNEAPPSYAEATGSSASLPLSGQQSGYVDEKERLRRSLRSMSGSRLSPQRSRGRLEFVVDFKKPMLDFWTLNITPVKPLPELSYWQLRYTTRYKATMRRHAPEPQSNLPLKEIAEIKFPETLTPTTGPTIKFWPHEEEITRRGLRHVSATDRMMDCSGWLTTKFSLDLPALGGSRVTWRVPKGKESVKSQPDQEASAQQGSSTSEKSSSQTTAKDDRRSTMKSPSWTPFPPQQLVEELSKRVLATYARAAPWAKHQGYLKILPFEQELTAEVIEGIVIATAALVGMQDAMGVTASLIESGVDSVRIMGKGKSKDSG